MTKKFKKEDGYQEKDFLHFGYDHIDTGIFLLKNGQLNQFDSAGALIHLGLEQILKAWHLHDFSYFSNKHNLNDLITPLQKINLTKTFKKTLKMLDEYFLLRYPRRVEGPVEIGDDDIEKIEQLLEYLWEIMPEELKVASNNLDCLRKGGRITMEKKI